MKTSLFPFAFSFIYSINKVYKEQKKRLFFLLNFQELFLLMSAD